MAFCPTRAGPILLGVDEFNRLGSLASVVIIVAVLAMATILALLVRTVLLAAG